MAEFADAVAAFAKKTTAKLDFIPRKVAMEVLKRVVMRSPVGNVRNWKTKYPPHGYVGGRFRGNWQVGIGTFPTGELTRIDPTGSTAIADGTARIMAAKPTQKDASINIVNNLPYGEPLEKGHSKQAPQGMVSITVAEFGGIVEEAVR